MALAIVQSSWSAVANAANPQTITLDTNPGAGHFVVLAASYNGGVVDTTAIADSPTNSYTAVLNQLGAASKTRLRAWNVRGGTVNDSHAFNLNPGGASDQGVHWGVIEFNADVHATMIDAASAAATGLNDASDAGVTSGTPANGNVILIAAAATRGNFGTVGLNTPSGWTNLYLPAVTGGIGSSFCYKSVATAGVAQAIQFAHDNGDSSIDWVAGIVIVREVAASSGALLLGNPLGLNSRGVAA